MMYGFDMTPVGWLVMLGAWVLLVAAIILGAWVLARAMHDGQARQQTPLEILQARLARGEISSDEYEKVRQLLG